MKSSNLCQLLQIMSTADKRALRKFVRSPAHNARQDVIRLYDFILDNLNKNFALLTKQAGHASAFPGQVYDDQKMRYCMSALVKVVEHYLIWKEIKKRPVVSQLYLTSAYRKLAADKQTRHSLANATSLQKKTLGKDAEYYELDFQIEMETYLFALGEKRTAPRNLQEINRSIDMAYLARKLRQSCLALSHGAVANVEYDSGLLDLILSYLENADWLDEHPAIALYFFFYQASTKGDDRYFFKLKKGLVEAKDVLSASELRSLYLHAINYTIRRYNQGEQRFLTEMFELYRSALGQEILLENGELSRFAFKNIAGIATRLGEYEWAEQFIENYAPNVAVQYRSNYRGYNLAKLRFALGRLDEALKLLQNIEQEDVFFSLDVKVHLLKIHFEKGEHEIVDSFINTFQRFLNRKKELGYHRENYTNTLQFTRRLLTLNPFDKSEKEALRKEIIEAKTVGEREWLLERLG